MTNPKTLAGFAAANSAAVAPPSERPVTNGASATLSHGTAEFIAQEKARYAKVVKAAGIKPM